MPSPVCQLGDLVFHHQLMAERQLRIIDRLVADPGRAARRLDECLVHLPPAPEERPSSVQLGVRRLGEAAAGDDSPVLDLVDIRGRIADQLR